ncbi:hypothetical protein RDABS01_033768 [Bienertia sinuspersici]
MIEVGKSTEPSFTSLLSS